MSAIQRQPGLAAEPTSLAGLLKQPRYSDRFNEILKDRTPQFISSILQVGNSLGPDCEPKSIIGSAMIAAALNLPIDKNLGFAWLVPYKNRGQKSAQFQMGYKGYVQLALRTGQYSRLNVCKVYDGELGGMDKLTGDLTLDASKKKSDKVIGYASYIRLTSGFEHAEYWSVETVQEHAKRYSQAYRSGFETPWKTHFDEMAMKTVLSMHIRRWGPMSVDVHKAYQSDSAVVMDMDAEPVFADNAPAETNITPSLENQQANDDDQMDMSPPDPVKVPVAPAVIKPVPVFAGLHQLPEPMDEPAPPVTVVPVEAEIGSPQANLIELLETMNVRQTLFRNYVAVNRIDQSLGFSVEKLTNIADWPAEACAQMANDAAMMARVVQKFAKK